MRTIQFVPGVVASPAAITIPAWAPSIDAVVSAEITRVPAAVADHAAAAVAASIADHAAAAVAAAIADHAAAAVAAAIADHAVHSHDLAFSAGGAGATIIIGAALMSASSGAQVVGAGGPAGDGVRDNAAAQAHAAGAAAVAHAAGAAAVAHAAGAAPLAHGVGANPVVAAVPTKITAATFSLSVNTVLGDILRLSYVEWGEAVRVA